MVRRGASKVDEPQVVRALALLMEMARSRRGILLKSFADKRRYPLRMVYRLRDALLEAGAPIRVNPESPARWQLMDGWLPPAVVGAARDELMALFIARHLAPGLRGTSVGRSLDSLWAKLASTGSQQTLPLSEAVTLSMRSLSAIDYTRHQAVMDGLRAAIDARHAVRISYQAPNGVATERVIEPGFLHWDGGLEALYVPSWCRLRGAIRVFAVHRIVSIEPLANDPSRGIPTRRVIERAFRIWYRDQVEHVQVVFTARVAGEIRERRWHASQQLRDTADGGVRLALDISAPEELERWLLGFGPDVQVIEPARLADQVHRLHAQATGLGQLIEASQPTRSRKQTSKRAPEGEVAHARRSR